ncbi:hypothetical protein ACRBEV_23565 [Methylobacterium phyllosphaerae]
MEQAIVQSSQYVITAKGQGEIVQQTCAAAAAAVLVALTLEEAGYTVEVQDPMGNLLSHEHQSTIILTEPVSVDSSREAPCRPEGSLGQRRKRSGRPEAIANR